VSAMRDSGHTPDWSGPKVERVLRNGKRMFASAFKAWLVEEAGRPGASVAGLAMRHEVNANQLRRWMRLQQQEQASAGRAVLLPVTVTHSSLPSEGPAAAERSSPPVIEIELGGAKVRVRDGFDARQLRSVIEALRS